MKTRNSAATSAVHRSVLFIIVMLLQPAVMAQFENHLFSFPCRPAIDGQTFGLGDQNNDGYDDFLITDCFDEKVYIFYGGNPPDNIPDITLDISTYRSIAPLDCNGDGILDVVVVRQDMAYSIGEFTPALGEIYFGGSGIDSLSDITWHLNPIPDKDSIVSDLFGWKMDVIEDYNGDGYPELIIWDYQSSSPLLLPNNEVMNVPYGKMLFFEAAPMFDTIPHYELYVDTTSGLAVTQYSSGFSSGDINGDEMTDFTFDIRTKDSLNHNSPHTRRFYLGNRNFDFTVATEWKEDEHQFDAIDFLIIEDLNNDGKDDMFANSYGSFYPYWYLNTVWYGGYPIDTIPDIG